MVLLTCDLADVPLLDSKRGVLYGSTVYVDSIITCVLMYVCIYQHALPTHVLLKKIVLGSR